MFPPSGPRPTAKAFAAYRDGLVEQLDRFEDVLDALMLAAEARR